MIHALIVAAGLGNRMGSHKPKQYLLLNGQAILAYTIKAFDDCDAIDHIYIAIPKDDHTYCQNEIINTMELRTPVVLVDGGVRRQDSVCNGLKALVSTEGLVLIHDGVRPLVSLDLIKACIEGGQRHGACVPALPVHDTLKRVNARGHIEETIPRDGLYLAQTPQAFHVALIIKAHAEAQKHGWVATDDASLVEMLGEKVHIIPGTQENIKVTTPPDLNRAEAYLRSSL